MPGKAFVMAFVWSGWLIASVIAFMIVAYASFFGVGLIGLMIWFVTARVDMEQDGVVGAGVSPSCRRNVSSLTSTASGCFSYSASARMKPSTTAASSAFANRISIMPRA